MFCFERWVLWSQNSQCEPEEQKEKLTWVQQATWWLSHSSVNDYWSFKDLESELISASLHVFSIGFISAGKRRVEFHLAYLGLHMLSVFFPLDGPTCPSENQPSKFGDVFYFQRVLIHWLLSFPPLANNLYCENLNTLISDHPMHSLYLWDRATMLQLRKTLQCGE